MNVNGNRIADKSYRLTDSGIIHLSVKVVIVGCGRVGARLALQLTAEGHEVTVIDQSANAFSRLGENFAGTALIGNGIDEDMLKRAGIEEADAFCALTNGDNRNIMSAEMAQHVFNVPKVVCRIYDPIRYEVYKDLGLGVICPTIMGTDTVHQILVTD
jgi:trk system potassium uptake protein TrkA